VPAYPVLAYVDRIDGVASSFVNESGTRIRLSLRRGADANKVASAVRRVLSEQTKDLVPVPLPRAVTAAALRGEQWQDKNQLAQVVAGETHATPGRTPMLLIALLLAWVTIGLGLFWWQRRRRPNKEGTAPTGAAERGLRPVVS
jgi:hypothetical protein